MRIVITDCDHKDIAIEEQVAAEAGLMIRLENCRTEDEVIAQCADADALLVQYAPVTARVLAALPNLRVISRYGVGVDTIDVATAEQSGVAVMNVPHYCTDEVSDHAIALLLTLARGTSKYDRLVREGVWDAAAARPLYRIRGRVLGIIGYGAIGQAVARKATALGYEVVAHDVAFEPGSIAADGTPMLALEDLLVHAHAVTLHAPHVPSTHHLLNTARMRLMRPDAILVNTARGALIDSEALADVLEEGHLAGVALDVLEAEPPVAGDRLLRHPRVVLTLTSAGTQKKLRRS
ncbi:C-terminal binding protein [Arthrobacter sp. ATA002]|uniref:C-terminal binding protein n=1 Tax=Arthrobacter sp. ATA002 TaxID=2991715 RepID=UPI0022A7B4AE|nr:C-terminal binding protein [Arthrobacter sp. ATA002]WAP51853.1 C-terminal binding protein [Arthrobacter sp. ATA002]